MEQYFHLLLFTLHTSTNVKYYKWQCYVMNAFEGFVHIRMCLMLSCEADSVLERTHNPIKLRCMLQFWQLYDHSSQHLVRLKNLDKDTNFSIVNFYLDGNHIFSYELIRFEFHVLHVDSNFKSKFTSTNIWQQRLT